MPISITRADYDQLAHIATRFGQEAQTCQRMLDGLCTSMDTLQGGDWVGQGATKFYAEMSNTVLPSVMRLVKALTDAQRTTLQIRHEVKMAEDAAAAVLRDDGATSGESVNGSSKVLLKPLLAGGVSPIAAAILQRAASGDFATAARMLSTLPSDQRAIIAVQVGTTLSPASLGKIYADRANGQAAIRTLIGSMIEYQRTATNPELSESIAKVAYATTHANLIYETPDILLAQAAIIERCKTDPVFGKAIAEYLSKYANATLPTGALKQVIYRDGQLILVTHSASSVSDGVLVVQSSEFPITEATIQSLYSTKPYGGYVGGMEKQLANVFGSRRRLRTQLLARADAECLIRSND